MDSKVNKCIGSLGKRVCICLEKKLINEFLFDKKKKLKSTCLIFDSCKWKKKNL